MITIWATLCMLANPAVCVSEIITDTTLTPMLSMSACMGYEGQTSIANFLKEHAEYRQWTLAGWRCQFGRRINEKRI